MIGVLSKPKDEIDISEIQYLIESQVPEGEQIEFKETLPAKGDGSPDPWMPGQGSIGDRAKSEILKETVAFANAHGGALLLGIKESESKPPVASEISPIPRCAELAERLKLVFRDRVEPQLPVLDVFAVPTEDKSGVVIIRVGRSRLAPHRVTKTRICPIRRTDRCEEMSMREIQDMTLNISRGLERLDKRLSERSEHFQDEFKRLETPNDAFGFRMTAAPVGDEIRFDHVFGQGRILKRFDIPCPKVKRQNREAKRFLNYPENWPPQSWQPILRGARADLGYQMNSPTEIAYRELHCDGLGEMGFLSVSSIFRECLVSPDWFIGMFANLAVWADHVRKQADSPTAEYALEVEIRTLGFPVFAGNNNTLFKAKVSGAGDLEGYFSKLSDLKFPRYSLGDTDEIPNLLALFHRDFWHSLREDVGSEELTFGIVG